MLKAIEGAVSELLEGDIVGPRCADEVTAALRSLMSCCRLDICKSMCCFI
jgi:hypothetical protein